MQARVIHADGFVGEVTVKCLKCGALIVLIRNGEKTKKEERICCGCEIDFLHMAIIKK